MSPVSELSFPAVTICTAGMNLNAVKVALNIDKVQWGRSRGEAFRRGKREVEDKDSLDQEYLRSRFGSPDFPVLEIVKGLGSSSSSDPMAAAVMSGLHNYAGAGACRLTNQTHFAQKFKNFLRTPRS